MIVVDASVLIAAAEVADKHHARAFQLLERHIDDDLRISPLTLAEFYVLPARRGSLDLAVSAVRALGVVEVPLVDDAPVLLARLRASTGLQLPDCCVLLAAQTCSGTLATFDERLMVAATSCGVSLAT